MHSTLQGNQTLPILLVEDDEIDRENVQRAFEKNKILNPLHIACDGYEAYGILTGEYGFEQLNPLPEILLLDINMPRMNGLELLEKIRKHDILRTSSVFMMTTSDEEQDIYAAYNLNVAGYIMKPVKIEAFLEITAILDLYWSIQHFPKPQQVEVK